MQNLKKLDIVIKQLQEYKTISVYSILKYLNCKDSTITLIFLNQRLKILDSDSVIFQKNKNGKERFYISNKSKFFCKND